VLIRLILVSLCMYAGREDEARATVAEIQRIAPNFSVVHRSTIIGHPVRHFHAALCVDMSCSFRT